MNRPAVLNTIDIAIGALQVKDCRHSALGLTADVIPAVKRMAASLQELVDHHGRRLADSGQLLPASEQPPEIQRAMHALSTFHNGEHP